MKFEELIKNHGFEPATFHKVAGLERQAVYNYRKGKSEPNIVNIKKIAKALNVSTDTVIACF